MVTENRGLPSDAHSAKPAGRSNLRPDTRAAACETGPADMRPLSSLRRGQTGVVCMKAVGPQDRDMLHAMGLRANCALRLCRAGEPCIIALLDGEDCACRIGLAKELADRIFVSVTVGRK